MIKWSTIKQRFKEWLFVDQTPEQEKREQFHTDISRISLKINNAFLKSHWEELQEEIHLFAMMFSGYEQTANIIKRWQEIIRDRKQLIHLNELKKDKRFN